MKIPQKTTALFLVCALLLAAGCIKTVARSKNPPKEDSKAASNIPLHCGQDCLENSSAEPQVKFEPVWHGVPMETSQFQGFTVVHSLPQNPLGLVYVFHGSGGSAEFINQIETIDLLNALQDAGYGWVATESTQRSADKRWDVRPLATNPDLARLLALHQELIDTTGVTDSTPVFALGMSNGAAFAATFANYLAANTTIPIRAVAMYEAAIPNPVFENGVTVPIFSVRAENDAIADNLRLQDQLISLCKRGNLPTHNLLAREQPIDPRRFLRIPEIDPSEAQVAFESLITAGFIDEMGNRILSANKAVAQAAQFTVPGLSSAELRALQDQVLVAWAMHQMRADFSAQNVAFFECFRKIAWHPSAVVRCT